MCSTGPSVFTASAREVVLEREIHKQLHLLLKKEKNKSSLQDQDQSQNQNQNQNQDQNKIFDPLNIHNTLQAIQNQSLSYHHPSLLLSSLTQNDKINEDLLSTYKLAGLDFKPYGGKFKSVRIKLSQNPNHYMNMHKTKQHLLNSYFPGNFNQTPSNVRSVVLITFLVLDINSTR